MHEITANLHMHTPYSDGFGTHRQIARYAAAAGLDLVMVTDHNVHVRGVEGYYEEGGKRVLLLVGEEVHDATRQPQKNHLLVFGAEQSLARQAGDPQGLISAAHDAGGLAFIAHPNDPASRHLGQEDLSWVNWEVEGYQGIEVWNALSELKPRSPTLLHALFYAYFPRLLAKSPMPATLKLWDSLNAKGKPVVGLGGSDAHAIPIRRGVLRRTIFPYLYHFRAINNHLLLPQPLTGDLVFDKIMIMQALKRGCLFIGYDLPHSTCGFRFTAQTAQGALPMGSETLHAGGVTFQIRLPLPVECRLLRDGVVVKTWKKRETCTYLTAEPGVYRVEAYLRYLGERRTWILSNPIYVR